jgi:pseudouridine-5'-phosphate glycosidase
MANFSLHNDVAEALADGRPVVALESALISHGLPAPHNLHAAQKAENAIRAGGAVPATIAVIAGQVHVGLSPSELERLADTNNLCKISTDNLATAIAQEATGGTTVAATMACAHRAGIGIFSTGGIGGVHRGWQESFDISADLRELARTPVTVVCSGAKSLLDLPATLEHLETMGVPVIGLATRKLPAFFSVDSGLVLRQSASDVTEVATIIAERRDLQLKGGEILAVPPPMKAALPWPDVCEWIDSAVSEARTAELRGALVTPFLLTRLTELSGGRTLNTNIALIERNATIATALAVEICAQ